MDSDSIKCPRCSASELDFDIVTGRCIMCGYAEGDTTSLEAIEETQQALSDAVSAWLTQ